MDKSACISNEYANSEQVSNCQVIGDDAEQTDTFPTRTNTWAYRPHGALARALYEKQLSDEHLESLDKNQWYDCDLDAIPENVSRKFIKLSYDEDTDIFVKKSIEKSDWIFMQLWHSLAKSILSWFMTQTSINGLLGRGSMFVLSHNQFLQLIGALHGVSDWRRANLLDLGAGDGEVTAKVAVSFDNIYVTEMSSIMRGLLQKRGYHVLDINNWATPNTYDVITCLNLLDRCDKPLTLLEQIKNSLKPDGILVVALVLPVSQYVESGRADHRPEEVLPITGTTFEMQIDSVINNVFIPAGFEVISWSKVPYLCEGDLMQCYYWLSDSIFILKSLSSH